MRNLCVRVVVSISFLIAFGSYAGAQQERPDDLMTRFGHLFETPMRYCKRKASAKPKINSIRFKEIATDRQGRLFTMTIEVAVNPLHYYIKIDVGDENGVEVLVDGVEKNSTKYARSFGEPWQLLPKEAEKEIASHTESIVGAEGLSGFMKDSLDIEHLEYKGSGRIKGVPVRIFKSKFFLNYTLRPPGDAEVPVHEESDVTLWFRKSDCLLVKLVEVNDDDDGRTTVLLDYNVTLPSIAARLASKPLTK